MKNTSVDFQSRVFQLIIFWTLSLRREILKFFGNHGDFVHSNRLNRFFTVLCWSYRAKMASISLGKTGALRPSLFHVNTTFWSKVMNNKGYNLHIGFPANERFSLK